MSKILNFARKNILLIALSFVILSLLILMTLFWIRHGTFAIDETNTGVGIACPNIVMPGETITCDILLTVKNGDTILSVNANYDFDEAIEYVSFGANTDCEEDKCFEPITYTEDGFKVENTNGTTNDMVVGKLTVKLADDATNNTYYKIGLKNVALTDSELTSIDLEPVTVNVRTKNNDASLKNIGLSVGSLNETFDSEVLEYTADVNSDVDKLEITVSKNDDNATVTGTGSVGEVNLHYGTNSFDIIVTSEDGNETNTYILNIKRDYEFSTSVYTYNKEDNYIYTKTDTGDTIKANLELLDNDLSYNINDDKLEIKYGLDEVLKSIDIINFTVPYQIVDKKLFIDNNLTYANLSSKITSVGLNFKLYDNSNKEVSDDSTIITVEHVLKVYYDDKELDSYGFNMQYLNLDSSLIVDADNKLIKRLKNGMTYAELKNKIYTNVNITITSNDGENVTDTDIVKTGDAINILLDNGTVSYTLSVLGDLTGDGVVKVNDVGKLYRHLKGRDNITDESVLSAGNIVNDGEIKISDVSRLYRYVKERITSLEVSE